MACPTCSDVLYPVTVDVLAKQKLPDCVDGFEDLGYFGDDLDSTHLRTCPECGAYFAERYQDHFEEGGAVGASIHRINEPEAAEILKKVVAELDTFKWRQARYDVAKIRGELKHLTSD